MIRIDKYNIYKYILYTFNIYFDNVSPDIILIIFFINFIKICYKTIMFILNIIYTLITFRGCLIVGN